MSDRKSTSVIPGTRKGRRTLVEAICDGRKCIWNKKIEGTSLEKFKERIRKKYNVKIGTYWELHDWSVRNYKTFWAEVWDFFGFIYSQHYEKVATDARLFTDVEWFPGARINYAENMMKYKDDRLALIYADEEGGEEQVTFAELHEKVRLYASALKKLGLKRGDTVACYMSNRLEAVFAMLGATSIGALFGGPLPFYGAKAATNIIKQLKPKFLFTVDRFQEERKEHNIIEKLPYITREVKCIEKVIIVPTRTETRTLDISDIENGCFIDEFLAEGRDSNGKISELVFEQLPFNHPIFVNFTSGTTGLPKGLVHSSGMFLYNLVIYGLHCNVTRSDVILQTLPVGWNVWNYYLSNLALGCTVLLYNGNPYFLSETYLWDLLAKYKVTYTLIVTSIVDKLDKECVKPSSGCNLDNLRLIEMAGSPVKLQNVEYFARCCPEDLFVGCMYGSTEMGGPFTGYDFNEPMYSGELQCPALGVDLKCIDHEGNHVVGQKGQIVLGTPVPSLPVDALGDRSILEETYFSRFPGFWSQHDEAWFDPVTRGFLVTGRSDETLNPHGERFGPSDIYYAIHTMEELADYLCVGQYNNEGDERVILFIKMKDGCMFNEDLVKKIKERINSELTEDFVPEVVLEAKDIPYNLNNKRLELLVKSIIANNTVPDVTNVRNPECLESFCNIPELQGY